MKDVQARVEASSPLKRTSSSSKQEMDPHCQYGSGSSRQVSMRIRIYNNNFINNILLGYKNENCSTYLSIHPGCVLVFSDKIIQLRLLPPYVNVLIKNLLYCKRHKIFSELEPFILGRVFQYKEKIIPEFNIGAHAWKRSGCYGAGHAKVPPPSPPPPGRDGLLIERCC
jgi:hypothetical protein